MSAQSQFRMNDISTQPSTSVQSGILQRKCDCGTHTVAGDKCEDCRNRQSALQRKSSGNSERAEAPPIVREVLNSSGQPLDKTTRAFFESRFSHNFSKVPISPVSQKMSQSSLKIGEATDVYEQEADRAANSIMLREKNKALSANETEGGKFDLSHVRIHTDARAAESARAINAQAYTFGNNIVFDAGQFAPGTHRGQYLLAHELAHVVQQSDSAGKIRRKVNYLKPDIVETDPVTTVLDNPNLALTTPKINGQLLPEPVIKNKVPDYSAAGQIIFSVFNAGVTIDRKDGKSTCKAQEPTVNVSSRISILKKPDDKVWRGSAPGARFQDRNKACSSVSDVPVYIKGKSGADAITVYDKVMANEMEHVDDLNKGSKKHFESFIDFLNKFNTELSNKKTEEADCQKAFTDYVNGKDPNTDSVTGKDSKMIMDFLAELSRLVSVRDKKGGTHDFKPEIDATEKDCFNVTIKI